MDEALSFVYASNRRPGEFSLRGDAAAAAAIIRGGRGLPAALQCLRSRVVVKFGTDFIHRYNLWAVQKPKKKKCIQPWKNMMNKEISTERSEWVHTLA